MAGKRQTLSRCFLLFRELQTFDPGLHPVPVNPHSPCKPLAGEYVSPFARTGPGFATDGYPKFDLDRWNPEFFERLHGFLTAAQERDVIVELTLFSNTYHQAVWNLNPLNAVNNINGVGTIARQDYLSLRDSVLHERQLDYVRKIVREVNAYDNIYFEVCNEPFTEQASLTPLGDHATAEEFLDWHRSVRAAIRGVEAELPKQHLIFQVPTESWRTDTALEHTLAEGEIDAVNLHDYQNLSYKGTPLPPLSRFMHRDLRLARIQHLWTSVHEVGRPFVFDEDNAATNALDEQAWIIHRKRAWTTICSGGHYNMIDFSIQVGGQERGTPASQATIRSWMKHLSSFIHGTGFVAMRPIREFALERPDATLDVTLANDAEEYVIYLADAREVDDVTLGEPRAGTLRFTLPEGNYCARLFSPAQGRYQEGAIGLAGGDVSLDLAPFTHDLAIHIEASN
ncbi:MAG: cellulase family glycosylhydrolase, partial [Truepera sp.]|nr:cellulase family glycosylhydrolase [Truepera sp.]